MNKVLGAEKGEAFNLMVLELIIERSRVFRATLLK